MTLNELIWRHLTNLDDENEVVAMTLVVKDASGGLTYYGVDDYGCMFSSEEKKRNTKKN